MSRTHSGSAVAIVAGAFGSGVCAALLAYARFDGWNAHAAQLAARWAARVAFPWFGLAWSASALAMAWPGGWRAHLLQRRRALGLGFAAAHGVHLIALSIAVLVFARPTTMVTWVGGGAVYALLGAMALTSSDRALRAIGPAAWRSLHTLGGWVIALAFGASYAGRLETNPRVAIPALGLLSAAALLRALAWRKRANFSAA